MPRAELVPMNLRVTPEARAAWEAFAAEHDTTRSALAEAISRVMLQEGGSLSAAIAEAQRISRDRLSRKE